MAEFELEKSGKRMFEAGHGDPEKGYYPAPGNLLISADLVARRFLAPIILPVGAITAFVGASLFLENQ
ncbi:hypothetical protein MSSAC_2243 [Methanosarcina siciliae C2J]|uniref:Uncharacterized protein n=2 Tax=Methanosarcina siciliae TaxID=38027 RepID=A0A0E3PMT4_9EURY|nr:hypothetical protein MSSAC_2243 [Methanosarcina siciliae C2J]